MKEKPYEYKILVEYIQPEERGKVAHLTHETDQMAFTKILEEVFEHLPESIPRGWEVNSHAVTVSRDTVIVTVLLRRSV